MRPAGSGLSAYFSVCLFPGERWLGFKGGALSVRQVVMSYLRLWDDCVICRSFCDSRSFSYCYYSDRGGCPLIMCTSDDKTEVADQLPCVSADKLTKPQTTSFSPAQNMPRDVS